jgi:vitamin B12/bleomycin/antimicrobial peptide transport system ATP-binding/permease protein
MGEGVGPGVEGSDLNVKADFPPPAEEQSFGQQLAMMRRAFMGSPLRNPILLLCLGLLGVLLATAYGQVVLNSWNQPFYDAIEKRNMAGFFHQLGVFAEIAGVLLVLNVAQTWLNQMMHLKLREGLTRDLLDEWMRPRRALRLSDSGFIGVNPDQRLHEDARHLADLTADLGIGLVQAAILLVSFIGVLWTISDGFSFHFWGRDVAIPGYMVWAAIVYAGVASCLSWLAGRPLIKLNNDRYAREADLRFSLVRVNENVEAISLAAGEGDEKRRLEGSLASVLFATRRIMSAVVNLTWVTAGYGWITVVAPIVIASPVYFSGSISFGGLMMAAAAFTQVNASLRWFVDHIGAVADWRASLMRVAGFRYALIKSAEAPERRRQIAVSQTEDARITLDDVEVASSGGRTRLSEAHVAISPGEHVAFVGAPGVGKTLLFKALAGMWPRGTGRIGLPAHEEIVFVPATPYFPPGTLREALTYPLGPAAFADAAIVAALGRLGLSRLAPLLDRDARWDREMNDDDKRLLAFARLALHKPRWIVVNEAIDPLQGEARRLVLDLVQKDLADSAVLNLGQVQGRDAAFFPRVVRLFIDPKFSPAETEKRMASVA